MKPDWSTAPDFARYLAQDKDGEWYWFENKPIIESNELWDSQGMQQLAFCPPNWRDTLEERPVHSEHEAEGRK